MESRALAAFKNVFFSLLQFYAQEVTWGKKAKSCAWITKFMLLIYGLLFLASDSCFQAQSVHHWQFK